MRIEISFRMAGENQWECNDGGFGQSDETKAAFAVNFPDDSDQHGSIAAVLVRLLDAINPPRKLAIVAEIIWTYLSDSVDMDGECRGLVMEAQKVCEYYRKMDEDREP